MKVGRTYVFDSAPQIAYDAWGRPVILSGKLELVKEKDTLMDKIKGRSWYVADGKLLIFLQRGGYVEKRCLREALKA